MIAHDYAKALFELQSPSVENLRKVLEHRGHMKLLPKIFAEYQKLQLQKERIENYKKETPESRRSRVLVQLYKKLISTTN